MAAAAARGGGGAGDRPLAASRTRGAAGVGDRDHQARAPAPAFDDDLRPAVLDRVDDQVVERLLEPGRSPVRIASPARQRSCSEPPPSATLACQRATAERSAASQRTGSSARARGAPPLSSRSRRSRAAAASRVELSDARRPLPAARAAARAPAAVAAARAGASSMRRVPAPRSSVDQPVADAPAIDHVAAVLGVEFAPQPARVRVEGAGLSRGAVPPDVFEQLLLREDPDRVGGKDAQQRELLVGEADVTAFDPDPAPRRVDDQLADPARALLAAAAPAQDRVDRGPAAPGSGRA